MEPETETRQLSKSPRPYNTNRLFRRFYEPLVLLSALDPKGQQRIRRPAIERADTSYMTLVERRRLFLDQLSYVCDSTKGGDTVTAMALQERPSGVIFWITANSEVPASTLSFLKTLLGTLQDIPPDQDDSDRDATEARVAQMCIRFCSRRISVYHKLIEAPLQRCIASLRSSQEATEVTLRNWLVQFQHWESSMSDLCHFAYQQRSNPCMKELYKRGDGLVTITEGQSKKDAFFLTRHYIGRLGSHLRAAKVLVATRSRIPGLFDDFTVQKLAAPKAETSPPPINHRTTIEEILKRMLPANSSKLADYGEDLAAMDRNFDLRGRVTEMYKDKEFRPRVHAELNLLEHFYREQLEFVDNDRFIACSKPACYCCYHYICQHPGGFVRPPAHGTRYLNWRPPDLANTADELEVTHQRDVLNKVIREIRSDVLKIIEQRRPRSRWRPLSTTGVTNSEKPAGPLRQHSRQLDDTTDAPKLETSAASMSASPNIDLSILSENGESLHEEEADSDYESDGGARLT